MLSYVYIYIYIHIYIYIYIYIPMVRFCMCITIGSRNPPAHQREALGPAATYLGPAATYLGSAREAYTGKCHPRTKPADVSHLFAFVFRYPSPRAKVNVWCLAPAPSNDGLFKGTKPLRLCAFRTSAAIRCIPEVIRAQPTSPNVL